MPAAIEAAKKAEKSNRQCVFPARQKIFKQNAFLLIINLVT